MLRPNVNPSGGGGIGTGVNNYDSLRLLVLGDSGVGKSSLVHILCNGTVLTNPTWTIGASVEVKLHSYKEGISSACKEKQKPFIIEFFDIGGSLQHKSSRHIFYSNFHGVILVHDLTNKKSLNNILKWRDELLSKLNNFDSTNYNSYEKAAAPTHKRSDAKMDQFYLPVPVLMVGTKSDIAPSPSRSLLNGFQLKLTKWSPLIEPSNRFSSDRSVEKFTVWFFLGPRPFMSFLVQFLSSFEGMKGLGQLRFDRSASVAKEVGACDTIKLNCLNASMVQPGSSTAVTLSKFYDKVIENCSNQKMAAATMHNNYTHSYYGATNKLSNTFSKSSTGSLTRIHIE